MVNSNEYTVKQKVNVEINLTICEERVYVGTCSKCGKKHIGSNVLHADETGCRVNAKTNWVQVFSNKFFTLCSLPLKETSELIP